MAFGAQIGALFQQNLRISTLIEYQRKYLRYYYFDQYIKPNTVHVLKPDFHIIVKYLLIFKSVEELQEEYADGYMVKVD